MSRWRFPPRQMCGAAAGVWTTRRCWIWCVAKESRRLSTRRIRTPPPPTRPPGGSRRAAAIPYLRFERPPCIDAPQPGAHFTPDHDQAALVAASFGRAILLTTGANNLAPYVREAARAGVKLIVRVLPRAESLEACRQAGIQPQCIIAQRGPFTLAQNIEHIRMHGIGTLVTKDGGQAGGTDAKIAAARQEGCRVVVVAPPPRREARQSPVSRISSARSGVGAGPVAKRGLSTFPSLFADWRWTQAQTRRSPMTRHRTGEKLNVPFWPNAASVLALQRHFAVFGLSNEYLIFQGLAAIASVTTRPAPDWSLVIGHWSLRHWPLVIASLVIMMVPSN